MGAIGESICIENSFGIAVELIGGLQFGCAESAVDKKFDPNRNTGRSSRPDNRRTAQRRAIGNIGEDQEDTRCDHLNGSVDTGCEERGIGLGDTDSLEDLGRVIT